MFNVHSVSFKAQICNIQVKRAKSADYPLWYRTKSFCFLLCNKLNGFDTIRLKYFAQHSTAHTQPNRNKSFLGGKVSPDLSL